MIIKEAEYRYCGECGRRELIKEAVMGCDQCGQSLGDDYPLNLAVFNKGLKTENYHYCSWDCLLESLSSLSAECFISFPTLDFEERMPERGVQGFWEAVKRWQ